MGSDYQMDLSRISLLDLQNRIQHGRVLPSRIILKEDLIDRFSTIRSTGVSDLSELQIKLKTKKKMKSYSIETGLAIDYLTILRREINSFISNPFPLSKIPDLPEDNIRRLETAGIKSTLHMFENGKTKEMRKELANRIGVSENSILEMVKLSDLSRIMGVGPVFARTWYLSGVDTVEKVASMDPVSIFNKLSITYEQQGFESVDFVQRDIDWCIDAAKLLPWVVEY